MLLVDKIINLIFGWTTMRIFGGSFGGSKSKSKSKSDFWTKGQKGVESKLGLTFGDWFDADGKLKPVEKYTGKLHTPGQTYSSLFNAAANRWGGGGQMQESTGGTFDKSKPQLTGQVGPDGKVADVFGHYDYFGDPQERVAEAVELRQRVLDPAQEREDSLLRSRMANMGLTHSSDMLKHQSDVERLRQAQTEQFAFNALDKYEALGFQAGEAELATMQNIGAAQYDIENAGLQADFAEFLRQQPEFNPKLEQLMAYLGLQGMSKTKGNGTSMGGSIGGSFGGKK